MIVSIHQPSYFPWLGLLHKIAKSDICIILDNVQLSDSGFQNRNLFLTACGQKKFLTIPIHRKNYKQNVIKELKIKNTSWLINHMNFLRNSYGKHPFKLEILPILESYFEDQSDKLIEKIYGSMKICFQLLDIRTEIIFQSDLNYDTSLRKSDLVLNILREVGATNYLSGTGAKAYLDFQEFDKDIALHFDDFEHPLYSQKGINIFEPGLSCLDLLFNQGISASRQIVQSWCEE